MSISDQKKIKDLIDQGYHVEVVNPTGITFDQKYRVWQDVNWNKLKLAVVDNSGTVNGLQG